MEKGEATRMSVDRLLAKWALEENIIERRDDGEYRLCAGNGMGGGEPGVKDSIVAYSDGRGRGGDDDDERMELD